MEPEKDAAAATGSLRERKKRETRQRISDVATALFGARGFDHVTVAEVAKAAEVSTMTVFNHFPRKEDLFLDRIPEAVELFSAAVRDRPEGTPPLAGLRELLLRLLDQGHPLAGVGDTFPHFWRIVLGSPALRARAREGVEELEDALAEAIGGPGARLTAALTVAAYRTVYVTTARRLLAGERAADIAEDHRARVDAAFDAVERALSPEA
ncbi:TetR/AcrR family transcriptional regulator [Streptomyces lavendulae]|uniref:TetR/AcrR family transcriptional regulator n=1 Tax=Streptomyces lavendulae TaxID=1914 RepID=UPI0025552EDE|nr:TetR/AcrR family transcriptional regulator [Streptomyces lavendulae]